MPTKRNKMKPGSEISAPPGYAGGPAANLAPPKAKKRKKAAKRGASRAGPFGHLAREGY